MTKLLEHLVLAITLSGIVSIGIQTVKERLKDYKLSGKAWFVITIATSVIIAWGYGSYYLELPLDEVVAVATLSFIGSQAIYKSLLDKGE